MKKLIMTLAVVCAAAITQASNCTWGSGTIYNHLGNKASTGNVTAWMYTITSDQYDKYSVMDAEDLSLAIYNDFMAKGVTELKKKSTTSTGIANITTTAVTTRELYAFLYVDNVNKDWVLGNVADYTFSGSGVASVANLAVYVGGGTSGTETEWAAVPEPFSGTLALLGMGAIALRRKMKKAKKA